MLATEKHLLADAEVGNTVSKAQKSLLHVIGIVSDTNSKQEQE